MQGEENEDDDVSIYSRIKTICMVISNKYNWLFCRLAIFAPQTHFLASTSMTTALNAIDGPIVQLN